MQAIGFSLLNIKYKNNGLPDFSSATLTNALYGKTVIDYLVFANEGLFSFGLIQAFKSHFSEGFPTSVALFSSITRLALASL